MNPDGAAEEYHHAQRMIRSIIGEQCVNTCQQVRFDPGQSGAIISAWPESWKSWRVLSFDEMRGCECPHRG
jgi:hypothetical protein